MIGIMEWWNDGILGLKAIRRGSRELKCSRILSELKFKVI